ncbi:MAG: imelysin family protein, partial [Bacteroidota bacterium]
YFNTDEKRLAFLSNLVSDMKNISENLASQWTNLRTPFIEAAGTDLGSAISGQLNGSLAYYEFTVREDKVGIPVGLVGPNDSPIDPDATKIEAFYRSQADENDSFPLALLRTSVEEMEQIYLGTTSNGTNGQGYDDLLMAREQLSIDTDIKAQFQAIYTEIDSRMSITEDNNRELYDLIQGLVTLYKSDLFPVLNIQDADGANDGD